jgi:antitoxin component YwqK of YwqJK toxin-antitoxin module
MKRLLAYLCAGLVALGLIAGCNRTPEDPALSSINIIDRNGFSETVSNPDRLSQYEKVDFLKEQPYQKVLRIFSRDEQGDIHAYITSYHPNGQTKQYLEVVNNRAYGTYREWHMNGKLKLEAFVIGGEADIDTASQKTWLFDGICLVWDEEEHLIAEIPYSHGELEGISTHYHPNGNVWKKVPCHKGQIDGVMEVYLADGTLLQTSEHHAGERNGCSNRYWPNGGLAAKEMYKDGKLIDAEYFDLNRTLISAIRDGNGERILFGKERVNESHTYRSGKQEGIVKVFAEDGDLAKSYHIKDGLKHGDEIDFYPGYETNGKLLPRLLIQWFEGRIQGVVKTWYPNGIQESQREMNNNLKNGLLTAWYADGSIMLIEEYDHDKLLNGEYFLRGEKIPISEVRGGKGLATIFDSSGNIMRKINYHNSHPTE